MKTIEVHDQVSLPLRRCFQLCVRGIRYRIFRSAITVVIVSLAVAFLMMMLSTSYVDREVGSDVYARTAGQRLLEACVAKLTIPMTGQVLTERLARLEPGSAAWREMRGWGKLSEPQLTRLRSVALEQKEYEGYLEGLEPGQRSALVGPREGEAAVVFLAEPGRLDEFMDKVKNFPGALPGDRQWVARLVSDLKETAPLRGKLLAGHAAAVEALKADLGNRSVLELFSRSDDKTAGQLAARGFLVSEDELGRLQAEAEGALDVQTIRGLLRDETMRYLIADRFGVEVKDVTPRHLLKLASRQRGARWLIEQVEQTRRHAMEKISALKSRLADLSALRERTPERIAEVSRGVRGKLLEARKADPAAKPAIASPDARLLAGLVKQDLIRKALAARLDVKAPLIAEEHVFEAAATIEGAHWLVEKVQVAQEQVPLEIRDRQQGLIEPLELSAKRVSQVTTAHLEQANLAEKMAGLEAEAGDAWLGFSRRTAWLIIISFFVCVVGVANAMLMSVTERFREIATMKCLGALDSFIMVIFVLESSLQGLAGGLVGVVIGLILGVLRSMWGFGGLVFPNLPGLVLLASAGVCLVAGVVLAAMAAVYPAWVAARLAPMEAMRIE